MNTNSRVSYIYTAEHVVYTNNTANCSMAKKQPSDEHSKKIASVYTFISMHKNNHAFDITNLLTRFAPNRRSEWVQPHAGHPLVRPIRQSLGPSTLMDRRRPVQNLSKIRL